VGLHGIIAEPAFLVFFVNVEVAFESDHLAIAFERQDVGCQAVKEPA
jgi:hypothetical protein